MLAILRPPQTPTPSPHKLESNPYRGRPDRRPPRYPEAEGTRQYQPRHPAFRQRQGRPPQDRSGLLHYRCSLQAVADQGRSRGWPGW